MVQPDKVWAEAKKKEDENFKFRRYLKGHADEAELDRQFLRLQTKHKPCDFLQKDGSCKLGDCKPDSCKNYPYTDQPERLSSLLSILGTIEICPAAFEIFERLKKEYRFKMRV